LPTGPREKSEIRPVIVRDVGGPFAARLYVPRGAAYGCIVVGHGVHYKGIAEPRLVRFATELASSGMVVLTPELSDLADYRITRSGADVLAQAVDQLSADCAAFDGKVGLLGFSFAGGLSLLAAERESVSRHLRYVASVGGYQDLRRVLGFLLTDRVEGPGGFESRKSHEYGLVVLLHEHLDAFVPEEDRDVMQRAVRAWLHEDRNQAWALASRRTTFAAERLFVALASGHAAEYRPELSRILSREAPDLATLSPRGHLERIPVPVYLLHGTGDSVIPPEETTWGGLELEHEHHPHVALVTPLIEHVEMSKKPSARDQIALVSFMAKLL
jgi:dienelactone hydrolase